MRFAYELCKAFISAKVCVKGTGFPRITALFCSNHKNINNNAGKERLSAINNGFYGVFRRTFYKLVVKLFLISSETRILSEIIENQKGTNVNNWTE